MSFHYTTVDTGAPIVRSASYYGESLVPHGHVDIHHTDHHVAHGHHDIHHDVHHDTHHVDVHHDVHHVDVHPSVHTHTSTHLDYLPTHTSTVAHVDHHAEVVPVGTRPLYDVVGKMKVKKVPLEKGLRGRLFGPKVNMPVWKDIRMVPGGHKTVYEARHYDVPHTATSQHTMPVASTVTTVYSDPVHHGAAYHTAFQPAHVDVHAHTPAHIHAPAHAHVDVHSHVDVHAHAPAHHVDVHAHAPAHHHVDVHAHAPAHHDVIVEHTAWEPVRAPVATHHHAVSGAQCHA